MPPRNQSGADEQLVIECAGHRSLKDLQQTATIALVSYPDLTTPPGERRSGKLRTLFSALTTLDVMAISDRMIIVAMATCTVCGVQSDKKRILHPAGPSNEKARLQMVCKRLQKPPTTP